MPSPRRDLGDFGESAARAHLLRAGYTILTSNWRCRIGEIDLVARQGGQLVFVEVRTRRADGPVPPEESLSPTKRRRLLALADAYMSEADLSPETPCRIDLIAIIIDRAGRVARLDHIVSAVEAG
ncbi:YraN family protein [Oscillochloris sp. ZM17-4]|uniref:YraN family protein n=1 Tax=Oscillochloris sp. ZM17-4 TaxID=2866714 RepID=UPI001C7373DF|nr:YraN family protein [Oscillochloris sp. ZM17-4]MBX0327296.1 YraN family protein [Oscillochloris sp. ZM17-4]